jgi:hypothetical protein
MFGCCVENVVGGDEPNTLLVFVKLPPPKPWSARRWKCRPRAHARTVRAPGGAGRTSKAGRRMGPTDEVERCAWTR